MSIVYFLFAQTLLFAIPLMIVALGGMFSERSGVVNLALEGIMIIGGFAGVFYLNYMQSNDILHGLPLLLTGLLISGIVGIVFSIKEDSDNKNNSTVVIETGGDRSKIRVKKWAIYSVETIHDTSVK